MGRPRLSYVIVVGHGEALEREDGAANLLRGLGARVRPLELWEDPIAVAPDDDEQVRAAVIEALDRPDWAAAALRNLHREPSLAGAGAIAAVTAARVAELDPASGFDDFVLAPYVPAELYARVRAVEWRKSEFATEERIKIGDLVIDRPGRQAVLAGKPVSLTHKEFALLVHLCDQRGRVVSRDEALSRVWGPSYEGGQRTVDIHIRRLRSKLGASLPLSTFRGAGYKLAAPATTASCQIDDGSFDSPSEPPPSSLPPRGRP